jgi:hypothetical protein
VPVNERITIDALERSDVGRKRAASDRWQALKDRRAAASERLSAELDRHTSMVDRRLAPTNESRQDGIGTRQWRIGRLAPTNEALLQSIARPPTPIAALEPGNAHMQNGNIPASGNPAKYLCTSASPASVGPWRRRGG